MADAQQWLAGNILIQKPVAAGASAVDGVNGAGRPARSDGRREESRMTDLTTAPAAPIRPRRVPVPPRIAVRGARSAPRRRCARPSPRSLAALVVRARCLRLRRRRPSRTTTCRAASAASPTSPASSSCRRRNAPPTGRGSASTRDHHRRQPLGVRRKAAPRSTTAAASSAWPATPTSTWRASTTAARAVRRAGPRDRPRPRARPRRGGARRHAERPGPAAAARGSTGSTSIPTGRTTQLVVREGEANVWLPLAARSRCCRARRRR